ncbi:MAG: hypothetical protein AAFX87_14940 [Bacteroidota bacterium]
MVTLDDFRLLPFEKKCEFVTFCGSYLAQTDMGNEKYYLYHLEDFYVEVCFDSSTNRVFSIQAFTDIARLDAYLEHVELSEIMNLI